jgi:hypothetical protein
MLQLDAVNAFVHADLDETAWGEPSFYYLPVLL